MILPHRLEDSDLSSDGWLPRKDICDGPFTPDVIRMVAQDHFHGFGPLCIQEYRIIKRQGDKLGTLPRWSGDADLLNVSS